MTDYKIRMKPMFKQALPKKATVSGQVKVTDKYECTVSMWVPHIPYSKNAPGIALTMRHGHGDTSEYFRLIFKQGSDLKVFLENLNRFVTSKLPYIEDAHNEALGEWMEAQAKRHGYRAEFGDLRTESADLKPS